MKMNEAFPSKWLSSADLDQDGPTPVTIEQVTQEPVRNPSTGKDQDKLVLTFEELEKPLICNVTNVRSIAAILKADDTDDWIGKQINLIVTDVEYAGETMLGFGSRRRSRSRRRNRPR